MAELPLNAVRWRGATRSGHQESFFLKANDPKDPSRAFWLKFTLLQPPGDPEGCLAEVWSIRFDGSGKGPIAGKVRLPLGDCELDRDGLGFSTGKQTLGPGHCRGEVAGEGSPFGWDLHFETDGQRCLFGLPARWMYEGGFPRNKLYTPYPRTLFSGWLSCGDERWTIDAWPGMQGHNWGPSHNPAYHWAQCCLFGDSDLVFEGYSAKLQLGPWLSPWLTGAVVRYEGCDIPFNRLAAALNRSVQVDRWSWSFASRQNGWGLRWEVEAPPEDFAGLRYFDPDGTERHCLNSKIATCRLELERREGSTWTQVGSWVGEKSCAYEVLVSSPDHGIPMLV